MRQDNYLYRTKMHVARLLAERKTKSYNNMQVKGSCTSIVYMKDAKDVLTFGIGNRN